MTIGNNEDLLNIVTNAPIGICILDAATLVTEMVNDAFLEVAGKPYEAIYGQYYWDSFAETASYYAPALAGVVETGITYRADEVELMLIRKGKEEWIHVTFVYEPVKDKNGTVQKVAIWVLENTQQVKARNEIQRLNEDLEARVAERTEELLSSNKELSQAQQHLLQLNDELEERVSARTMELMESENRFRLLMEQAPVALNLFETRDMVVTFANDRMLELWNRKPEDLNRPFIDIFPELAQQPFLQILDDVFVNGKPYYGYEDKAFILRNGQEEVRYFNLAYHPVRDVHKNVTNIIQVLSEVTEQVNARVAQQQMNEELTAINEELLAAQNTLINVNMQLRSSEVRLEQIITQLPAPVVLLSGPDQIIETTNEALLSFWDKTQEEVLGKPMLELFPELKNQPFPAQWKHVYETGEPIVNREMPVRFNRPAGERVFYVDYHYQPLRNLAGNVTGVLATVIDTTDKVLARRTIQESEERFRSMAESAGIYIAVSDTTTNATYFNNPWFALTGKSLEELLQKGWIDLVHPEDKEQIVTTYLEAFKEQKPFVGEFRVKKEDGQYIWLLLAGNPRFLSDGSFAGYISSSIDITERKKDEQRKNDFIGMVSHEMKTPLTSLNGYLQLLKMKSSNEDAFVATMLDKSNKQIARITTLINGFLNVSRLESGKIHIDKKRFDMAQLVKEAQDEVQSTINSHKVVFAPVQTTWVNADRDKINQVISNLVSNAVKYSPANTEINVACITVDGNATVSIRDEGIGIKEEDKDKLFDRYYRVNHDSMTSPSGFGIGLYLCAEIIQRHDGKIWVESEVSKGSTFLFTLPVVE